MGKIKDKIDTIVKNMCALGCGIECHGNKQDIEICVNGKKKWVCRQCFEVLNVLFRDGNESNLPESMDPKYKRV